MAARRRVIEFEMSEADRTALLLVARTRTEKTGRVERAQAHRVMAALNDLPRPGKAPTITAEARAWLVALACDKAKDRCRLTKLSAPPVSPVFEHWHQRAFSL